MVYIVSSPDDGTTSKFEVSSRTDHDILSSAVIVIYLFACWTKTRSVDSRIASHNHGLNIIVPQPRVMHLQRIPVKGTYIDGHVKYKSISLHERSMYENRLILRIKRYRIFQCQLSFGDKLHQIICATQVCLYFIVSSTLLQSRDRPYLHHLRHGCP